MEGRGGAAKKKNIESRKGKRYRVTIRYSTVLREMAEWGMAVLFNANINTWQEVMHSS